MLLAPDMPWNNHFASRIYGPLIPSRCRPPIRAANFRARPFVFHMQLRTQRNRRNCITEIIDPPRGNFVATRLQGRVPSFNDLFDCDRKARRHIVRDGKYDKKVDTWLRSYLRMAQRNRDINSALRLPAKYLEEDATSAKRARSVG